MSLFISTKESIYYTNNISIEKVKEKEIKIIFYIGEKQNTWNFNHNSLVERNFYFLILEKLIKNSIKNKETCLIDLEEINQEIDKFIKKSNEENI